MGSTGTNSIITQINNTKFKQLPQKMNGKFIFGLDIDGVGKGRIYLSTSDIWNITVAKELPNGQLEMVDIPSVVATANTQQGAENLVRQWLKAIANGQV